LKNNLKVRSILSYNIVVMFKKYCTKCDNLYDLTKTIPAAQARLDQKGGDDVTPDTVSSVTESSDVFDLDTLIAKILAGEAVTKTNLGSITLTQLSKNSSYKKLQGKDKELIYN
jgi:hypothetical protein